MTENTTDLDRYVAQSHKRGWIYIHDLSSNVELIWSKGILIASLLTKTGHEVSSLRCTPQELFKLIR